MAFVPSLAVRPLIALDAIGFYLGKLFVPLQLGADYGRTPQFVLGGASFQIGWVLLPVAGGRVGSGKASTHAAGRFRFIPRLARARAGAGSPSIFNAYPPWRTVMPIWRCSDRHSSLPGSSSAGGAGPCWLSPP